LDRREDYAVWAWSLRAKRENCDCAPDDHVCAISWEDAANENDSGRFLGRGARRSFWLRTKQGFLAEGMPLLRETLCMIRKTTIGAGSARILEKQHVLPISKAVAYLMASTRQKRFQGSAKLQMDRDSAFVLAPACAGGAERRPLAGLAAELLRANRNSCSVKVKPCRSNSCNKCWAPSMTRKASPCKHRSILAVDPCGLAAII